MKKIVTLFSLFSLCILAFGQNTIIPNNSFEEGWSVDTLLVPDEVIEAWADDTVVMRSGNDASTGSYALYLQNSGENDMGDPTNISYVLYGYPDDGSMKGIPYTAGGTPDSVHFSFAVETYSSSDSAEMWVGFYKGGMQISFDIFRLGSTGGMYVDTVIPIDLPVSDPDSILIAYASGQVMGSGDTDGNYAYFDDVYLSEGGVVILDGVVNGDFEEWDTVISETMDGMFRMIGDVSSTGDVYAGDAAVSVTTILNDGDFDPYYSAFTLWGERNYYTDPSTMDGGLPLPGDRNALAFYYKYILDNPAEPDTAEVILDFFRESDSMTYSVNAELLASDTFTIGAVWYNEHMPGWSISPDSIIVEFRSSKYRESSSLSYEPLGNELIIDSLFFLSEAPCEIIALTPDTIVQADETFAVEYSTNAISQAVEIFVYDESNEVVVLRTIGGPETNNEISVGGSPGDSLYVYIRDYYNFSMQDSFKVYIAEDVAPDDSTSGGDNSQLYDTIPNPSFEDWTETEIYSPSGLFSRATLDYDTAVCVSPSTDKVSGDYAMTLTTASGRISYAGYGDGQTMKGEPYSSATPDSIFFSYKADLLGTDTAEVWVFFYKNGVQISFDQFKLLSQAAFVDTAFALSLSESSPDSLFLAYASGSTVDDAVVEDGSSITFDNVYFVDSNGVIADAVPNGDFEDWDTINTQMADGVCGAEGAGDLEQTMDANTGNYAIQMMTIKEEESGGSYPFYNAIALWGKPYRGEGGLALIERKDQLVFSYKYLLHNDQQPDTAQVQLGVYDTEGQESWQTKDLYPTGNAYEEARISYDSSYFTHWLPSFDRMAVSFVTSKWRDNSNLLPYDVDSNLLIIDDLYWHSEAYSEIEILTPDTIIESGDPLTIRFNINGSRSDEYTFVASNEHGGWYVDHYMQEGNDYKTLTNSISGNPGESFMLYMVDDYNLDVIDSIMVTMAIPVKNDEFGSEEINVLPIPAKDQLMIKGLDGVKTIEFIDMTGVSVMAVVPSTVDEAIDVSSLEKGVYVVKLSKANDVLSRTIIIE